MSALKATRRLKGWRRWWDQLQVEARRSDIVAFVALTSLAVGLVVVGLIFQGLIPHIAMLLPMFFASMWLNPRRLPWFVIGCLVGACVLLSAEDSITIRTVVRVIVTFTIGLVILTSALRRSRLGVSGNRSESMFVDLRDRILRQGGIPALPDGWYAAAELRSAGGTPFAGAAMARRTRQAGGGSRIASSGRAAPMTNESADAAVFVRKVGHTQRGGRPIRSKRWATRSRRNTAGQSAPNWR